MISREHKLYLRKLKINKILVNVCQILILIFSIFIWEYLSSKGIINSFIYSSPSKVLRTIIDLYKENNLFNHIWITVYETVISFSLATILGTMIAIILWCSKFLYKVLDPYLTILNSLPKVALGPIIIIIFGANIKSIIIMALLISLIITISNVYSGFINTDKNKIKLMLSFKANKWQMLRYLIIPSNYHVIINSLKINVGMSLVGLLPPVGENFIV
ncbi:MAG: ABC transporter permease [Bacilli bacterium]